MEVHPEEIVDRITAFIRKIASGKKVVVGLSGGIDSTLVCLLAVQALGSTRVKALVVTNRRYPQDALNLARAFAQKQNIELQEVASHTFAQDLAETLQLDMGDVIRSSTLDARVCDLIIRTVSTMENRIYLGTINGTERLTGWYPKGNLVGDYCPIGGLLKTQEKEIARYLGLEKLIETISASAGKICSGCGELQEFESLPYELLDKILFLYETTRDHELLSVLDREKIPVDMYKKVLERILHVAHKQEVFPPFCPINTHNAAFA